MSSQQRTRKVKRQGRPDEVGVVEEIVAEVPEVDLSDYDDLLDEIDDVLEENAEAFVAEFIQNGGQ